MRVPAVRAALAAAALRAHGLFVPDSSQPRRVARVVPSSSCSSSRLAARPSSRSPRAPPPASHCLQGSGPAGPLPLDPARIASCRRRRLPATSALPEGEREKGRSGPPLGSTRRTLLRSCLPSILLACQTGAWGAASALLPSGALAIEGGEVDPTSSSAPEASEAAALDRAAALLRGIPAFCIVDRSGVPYVVVGEDAKVTGYFFTTYDEADRLLRVALESADRAIRAEGGGDAANPWRGARISSVPLAAAATLVTKSQASSGGRAHFQIAPAQADVDDALAVTGQADLAEGKVPLFYYQDWKDGKGQSPLFFSRSQLEQSYRASQAAGGGRGGRGSAQAASVPLPQARPNVTELFAVLARVVEDPADPELGDLALVPPPGSARRAKECARRGGTEPPFVLGRQVLVL